MLRIQNRSVPWRSLVDLSHLHDPDPADTMTGTIMFYLICENRRLRIEQARHITDLFALQRRLDLTDGAGFETEQYPCKCGNGPPRSILLLGTLRKAAPIPWRRFGTPFAFIRFS